MARQSTDMSQPVSENQATQSSVAPKVETLLEWRVHLMQRDRSRLKLVGVTLLFAFCAVWLMFHNPLPAVVAVALLIGASSEYLFPIRYPLTSEGVHADALTSRLALKWKEAKRLIPDPMGIVISPLSAPSRLDAFRGVLLRFAPDGEPGDRASVVALIEECKPEWVNVTKGEG